ncbi:MAG TPA: thiosulfate oxidation carrier protein SoxY [Azospirillum sp.]
MKMRSRRDVLRGALALGGLGAGTALLGLPPRAALAAWPKAAFDGKDTKEVLDALFQVQSAAASDAVKVRAPEIAENGTVVPVTVSTSLPKIESITLIAEGNPRPLAAIFRYSARSTGDVTTRIKLAKTQLVTAVVKSDGKLFKASREVKVTIGGCGG